MTKLYSKGLHCTMNSLYILLFNNIYKLILLNIFKEILTY